MLQRLAAFVSLILFAVAAPALAGSAAQNTLDARRALAAEAAALMQFETSIDAWKASLVSAQDFSQCGCSMAPEMRAKLQSAWSKAVGEEFNSGEVLAAITLALTEELTPAELGQAIRFRKSPLGMKVTAAETAKKGPATEQSPAAAMQEIAAMSKWLAARPARRANLQKVVAMSGGAQAMADAMINISIGTALGASAVAPKDQPRLSQAEIVEMIERARPQMERSFDAMMVPIYGTLYKPLSDKDLKALVKQLGTPAARKFMGVTLRAFNAGMRAQALKMGQRLGLEMQGENI
jgi:hypothetical protein